VCLSLTTRALGGVARPQRSTRSSRREARRSS
jgi:hypothetical protein